MSIYTAKTTGGTTVDHPLFEQRKIKGFTHATLSELVFVGLPTCQELAYGAYRTNIDAFVAATLSQKGTNTFDPGFDIPQEIIPIPFGYPPISFTMRKPLTAEQSDAFCKRNEKLKMTFEPIGKTPMFVVYVPNISFLKQLPSIARESSATRFDTCAPEAIPWLSFVWQCIDGFLRTYVLLLALIG